MTEDDLFAILTEPANALTKQYEALLGTEDWNSFSKMAGCGRSRDWRVFSTRGWKTLALVASRQSWKGR
ncbi:MAG: hypothetical protein R2845_10165 [Thermomicrobiales bacterium]